MAEPVSLVGTILQETYRLERLLGEGGMGAVYEASHLRVRRRFAVKVLQPAIARDAEAFARFRREAEITSELGHPNIIEVVDFNLTPEGAPFMVMELLRGEPLDQRLARAPRPPLDQVCAIVEQTASALEAAHGGGVVHRDLKPPNIFLADSGRGEVIKVLDFGISKVLGSSSLMTGAFSLLGTPNYMAPEQAEARHAQVGPRTDVFALGAITYELLAGRPAFLGDTIPAVLYQVVHAEPPSLAALRPELPAAALEAVQRAMRKSIAERTASAADLAAELLQGLGVTGTRPQPVVRVPPASVAGPSVSAGVPGTVAPPDSLPSLALGTAPTMATPGPTSGAVSPDGVQHAAPVASTTFSASVGEVASRPSSRRLALIAGPAALLVGLLAGGLYFGLRSPHAGQGSGSAAPPQPGSAAATRDAGSAMARLPDAAPSRRRDSAVSVESSRPDARVKRLRTSDPARKVEARVHRPEPGRKVAPKHGGDVVSGPPGHVVVTSPFGPDGKGVWASVHIDGRPYKETPTEAVLPPGRHTIVLQKKGFKPISHTVYVVSGKTVTLPSRKWEPAP